MTADNDSKKSSWRRGFVHLLKKKKLTNLGNSAGNNNNDVDSPSRNRMSNHNSANTASNALPSNNTRNGHARGAIRATPPNTLDIQATNVEIKWSPAKVVQNNTKGSVETGRSMQSLISYFSAFSSPLSSAAFQKSVQ